MLPAAIQCFLADSDIIKRQSLFPEDLFLFMTFSSDDHSIPRPCPADGVMNRFPAVGDADRIDPGSGKALCNLIEYSQGVL
jgi:hypothetical protein